MNEHIRKQFSALQRKINGQSITFLDGPAGTQVPDMVINAISNYYRKSNANTHGQFQTTIETDEVMQSTRDHCATFLNAESGHCISFGQNMTSLNFSLSRAVGRKLSPGDEILITQLDHESNRGPWLALRDSGIKVNEVALTKEGRLDYEDFDKKINSNVRLVAMGVASNYTGCINDVAFARQKTYEVGSWLLLDAVHYAPHFSIDVKAMDCDFLLCSAYKFYGPHVGILYSKQGLLDQLPTDRLRTAYQHAPYKIETGTLNHAAIAGVKASIEFIARMSDEDTLRGQIVDSLSLIGSHEAQLLTQLYQYINESSKYHIVGPDLSGQRAPTLSFYAEGIEAVDICKRLNEHNIFAWAGHFYAIRASEILGMQARGGVVRMGMSVYSSKEDIDKTIQVLYQMESSLGLLLQ